MKKNTTHSYVDTFFMFDEAYHWLDELRSEYNPDIWEVIEESIYLLNGGYRAGIVFQKKQLELDV